MTLPEIQHRCFAVAVFALFFRGAHDPIAVTALGIAVGFVIIALTDGFVRRRGQA